MDYVRDKKRKTCLVVLNYNDSDRCLNVIDYGKQHRLFDEYILVDNNSKQQDKDNLKKKLPNYVYLFENSSNLGYGAGHNVGLRFAVEKIKAEYIFIIVSDIKYSKKCITKCIDALNENKDMGVVSCRMKKPDKLEEMSAWEKPTYLSYLCWCYPLLRRFGKTRGYLYKKDDYLKNVDTLRGSFLCFRAEALKKANYFDEKIFMYNEENAMAARLISNGYRLGQLTDVFYIHNHVNHDLKCRSTWKSICKETASGVYYMEMYQNIKGIKLFLLKISTFHLCIYRYLGKCFMERKKDE